MSLTDFYSLGGPADFTLLISPCASHRLCIPKTIARAEL